MLIPLRMQLFLVLLFCICSGALSMKTKIQSSKPTRLLQRVKKQSNPSYKGFEDALYAARFAHALEQLERKNRDLYVKWIVAGFANENEIPTWVPIPMQKVPRPRKPVISKARKIKTFRSSSRPQSNVKSSKIIHSSRQPLSVFALAPKPLSPTSFSQTSFHPVHVLGKPQFPIVKGIPVASVQHRF